MKDSINFIEKHLSILFDKFPKSNFRYEFRENRDLHLIEVTPLHFYNNDSYMYCETEFEDEFELLFPQENLIFISQDSLNKIRNPRFELLAEKEFIFKHSFEQFSSYVMNCDNDSDAFFAEIAGVNNYALAA
jgi:hypothetical protein